MPLIHWPHTHVWSLGHITRHHRPALHHPHRRLSPPPPTQHSRKIGRFRPSLHGTCGRIGKNGVGNRECSPPLHEPPLTPYSLQYIASGPPTLTSHTPRVRGPAERAQHAARRDKSYLLPYTTGPTRLQHHFRPNYRMYAARESRSAGYPGGQPHRHATHRILRLPLRERTQSRSARHKSRQ
jgi:hypothetical protein